MAHEMKPYDISNTPELLRLAEEVRAARQPRVLKRNDEDVAVLMPMPRKPRRGGRDPKSALAALRASAGSWRGLIDAEQLKKEIKEARGSDRPDVQI